MAMIQQEKRQELFQAQVTTAEGEHIMVGPRFNERDAPTQLVENINKMVATGRMKDWHDARVVTVAAIQTE